jgi:hypothetical protein
MTLTCTTASISWLASIRLIPRVDLLRLITLAGFNPEDVLWVDAMGDDDPVIVLPLAVRQLVKLAREVGA